jgi:hypothetical protein
VNVHAVLDEIPQRLHVPILFSKHWSNDSTLLIRSINLPF